VLRQTASAEPGRRSVSRLLDRPALLLLAGVAVAVCAFQLYRTPGNPPGFHHDEASLAYNAWTISRDLRDQDGGFAPLYIVSYGDYKSPLFVYVLAGVFRVVYPSANAARELGAVSVLAAILLLGLLAYRRSRSAGVAAAVLALAVAVETYFQNERWPAIAALGVIVVSVLGAVLVYTVPLHQPFSLAPVTGQPVGDLYAAGSTTATGTNIPGSVRLLTPLLNISGGLTLALGALFSAYVFMPKRRVLGYSLDPNQKGDNFLFNLLISPVALVVNFIASLPGAVKALVQGRLHSRVPATILIALGAFVASAGDTLNRFGVTGPFAWAKLIAAVLLLAGFLVSIEAFRELRVPFTHIRIGGARRENPAPDQDAVASGANATA